MLYWHTTQSQQGILQALGQGGTALAAGHHVGVGVDMGEARVDQAKMIEPIGKPFAGDGNSEFVQVRKIRDPEDARPVPLTAEHLVLWPGLGTPMANAAFAGAAYAGTQFGMPTPHRFNDGYWAQRGGGFERGPDLCIEQNPERIGAALPWYLLLERESASIR